MRKLLMVTVLVGATAVPGARATPYACPIPPVPAALVAQSVHYYPTQYEEDWRHREWRRQEEFERWRRHQWRRHHRFEEREYGRRGW